MLRLPLVLGRIRLNAWCELSGEDLRGRCPFARVGLLTDPQGKGTDSSWSMWTPSSPYSTLSQTTSATPIRQKRGPARSPPSEREGCGPDLFARWGRFSSERDFYRYAEARLRDAFPTLPDRSQFNRLVRSHVGLLEAFTSHLAALLGARKSSLFTKHWIAPRCPLGTPSAGSTDGSPGVPTSVGVIAWDGTRGSGCSPPSTPPGSSRASASVPLPPLTSWRPKPSSPPEPGRTPDSGAWARPPRYPTWSTRASRGQITTDDGSDATERSLSARPNATPARCGPSV